MKTEEKQLILKDLCSRLPYGVKCNIGENIPYTLCRIEKDNMNGHLLDFIETKNGLDVQVYLSECKPYLFPLSSMTEKQREEIEDKLTFPNKSDGGWIEILYNNKYEIPFWFVDFCNKNHIDYRGLIPMGLAIDATGLNIYGNVY